jgi:hypothetical protein
MNEDRLRSRMYLGTLILSVALLPAAGVPGLAKDSRHLTLHHDAVLSGTSLPAGEYVVRWEAHRPRASVEFVRGKKVVLSTQCRFEDRGKKYLSNSVLYGTAPDGTMTISEIRFAGSSEVLVVERANLKIRLRMYNYGISHGLLSRSEGEATAILNQAGLEVAWVDCPLTTTELENYPGCQEPMGTADFVVKILTAGESERFSTHQEVLGQALECPRDQIGCSAYVFYRDVQGLARHEGAAESQLLGHALAHEIGHLLLGPNSHTAIGVMRAQWHRQDLQTISRAYLFFTDQQSRRIRDEVSARNTIQQGELARAKK